jgi:HD-GYP domain-containing protein (c-di-GMP phosphodiesterase class II)
MTRKLIKIKDLVPGMYIEEINCSPKERELIGETRSFLVLSRNEVERFADWGIRELYINPEKGLDHFDEDEERKKANNAIAELARLRNAQTPQEPKSLEDELYEARMLTKKARAELENAIKAIQSREEIKTGTTKALLEDIYKSVIENKDAIVTVCRKKLKDGYAIEHSVSHCALMMAFGQTLGMDKEALLDLGLGGLFHDIGKVKIPDAILNKPGKLTPQEMGAVKKHPLWGGELMKGADDFSDRALAVVLEHHERLDGTGYPYQLKEHEISLFGQMASIVDVFDASTSVRPYGTTTDPCLAIKELFEGAGTLFHKELVQQFIKTIGIYPVGTLARLESNKLGIVIRQTRSLSKPEVRIIYDLRHNRYLPPQDVDLTHLIGKEDKVVASESPEKWRIDPFRFIFPELVNAREAR